jgi:hypothetical protein
MTETKSKTLMHACNLLDPFYIKENGRTKRRPAPEGISSQEREAWKHVIKKAWTHDRCFFGWFWMDLGLGLAPIVSLIPIIGPLIMYVLHGRILSIAEELRIPATMHAKMASNILFDFLITLIPILGAIFSYINACSTRNAALVDTFLNQRQASLQRERGDFQLAEGGPQPAAQPSKKARIGRKPKLGQGAHQESGVLA